MSSSSQILEHPATQIVPVEAQAQWYALQTRPRHEKKVVAELQDKGISSYLPLLSQVRRWSDRRKILQLPLFSCYVFINALLTPTVRLSALSIWGALGFVGPSKQAMPIPASEIDDVRKLLESTTPLEPYPFLKIGQRVRVRGGCLDGVEGILVGRHQNRRLVISVEAIERSLSITLEGYDVVPI